jgi:isopentenyl-diphosphate delta-isomerase
VLTAKDVIMDKPQPRNRKLDHIDLALADDRPQRSAAGWDEVHLQPVALPGFDREACDCSTIFLGHLLKAPIMIAGMTGGHADTTRINAHLAVAARECGVAMGVGSQRAAIANPLVAESYRIARRTAPDVFICGNIGVSQLADGTATPSVIRQLVDMVEADAMALHINVLQELIQPEGAIGLARIYRDIEHFVTASPVPVIAKETGCGMDRKTAQRLKDAGVAALDVGGAGGTSFVKIEGVRARQAGGGRKERLAQTFAGWGLRTIDSVVQVREIGLPVIATGGVRHGLDVARAMALGATLAGVGRQMLAAAVVSEDRAVEEMRMIVDELRIAMVLSECADIAALRAVDIATD